MADLEGADADVGVDDDARGARGRAGGWSSSWTSRPPSSWPSSSAAPIPMRPLAATQTSRGTTTTACPTPTRTCSGRSPGGQPGAAQVDDEAADAEVVLGAHLRGADRADGAVADAAAGVDARRG